MNHFYQIIFSVILLFFPFNLYFIYIAHNKKIEIKENELFYGFVGFCSMYLIVILNGVALSPVSLSLINVPIIIAYIKDRYKEAWFLSIMMLLFKSRMLSIGHPILIVEAILFYLIFLIKKRTKMDSYIFISLVYALKSFVYIIDYFYIGTEYSSGFKTEDMLIAMPLALLITLFFQYISKFSDEVMNYHMKYRELIHEKQVRTSLFKITHEIKNPLAVCKGYLDMIDINNANQCRKYVPIVRDEIKRTLMILQDFSSFSKIKIEKDIMDINFLLNKAVKTLKPLLKNSKIEISFNEDDEIFMYADYNRLMQVFINIIKNSIESLDNRKNKKILIKEHVDRHNITVSIEDNGIGISEENLQRINDPFFTTKKEGTGLGVSLASEIIKAHSGTMQYASECGKGTIVKIKLPLKNY